MNRLGGKTAIVTGGARGIGAAYARGLAAEGANVVVCDVLDTADVVARIESAGSGSALGVKADVSSAVDVGKVVQAAEQRYGGIHVLVNNAAIFADLENRKFYEIPTAEWDNVMAVNARGAFEFAKAVVPIMRRQHYGKIVNVASGTFFKGSGLLHYVVSKGAAIAMTRVMARELGADNICVNCIAPGLTSSEGVMGNPDLASSMPRTIATRCLQRPQTPEDLVGAVLFFASADSDFVTGQTLLVDGGSAFN